jgi:hypothetical protein
MQVAVLATAREGMSTTIVGRQVMDGLSALGWDIVPITGDGKLSFSKVNGLPVVCLTEYSLNDLVSQLRYVHPTKIVSVILGNWEEHDLAFRLAYLSRFMSPSTNGVSMVHVHHSKFMQDSVLRTIRETLVPSLGRELCKQLHLIPYGIEKGFAPGRNDPDLLLVPYNRVNQTQKNVRLHAEATGKYQAWAVGAKYSPKSIFYVMDGLGPDDKDLEFDRSAYVFQPVIKDRVIFKQTVSQFGMFLCTSNFESFGIYYLELLSAGVVGVFADRPWIRTLLPDYPFIVAPSELSQCMAYVRENYEHCRKIVLEKAIPYIQANYTVDKFAAGLHKLLIAG